VRRAGEGEANSRRVLAQGARVLHRGFTIGRSEWRVTVLVFAGLYLEVRWLLRRSIREADRVEHGMPL
jgi:hypothetical protein